MVTQLAVVPHGRQVRQAERQLRQQMLLVRREPFERASAGTKRKREQGEEDGGKIGKPEQKPMPCDAREIPEPDPLPSISFDTRPDTDSIPDIPGITRKRKTIPSSGALFWDPRVQKKCKICHFNVKYDCGAPPGWTIIVQDL